MKVGSEMGSSKVEESASVEEVSTSDRPNFYPCVKCGEKFTFRALSVHRKQCKENGSCNCICCIHPAKRRKLNPEPESAVEVCSTSTATPSNNVNTLQNISQNSNVLPVSNLKNILLIRTTKNGVPLSLALTKSLTNGSEPLIGVSKQNEATVNEGERLISVMEYISVINNNSSASSVNNSENVDTGKEASETDQTGKNKEKNVIPLKKIFHSNGEQCKRKMFCSMCNNHVYWGTYGTHIIEHCEMEDKKPVCPICFRTSPSKVNFLMHYYEHYSTHPASCPECKCSDEACQLPFNKSEHSYASRNCNLCFICRDVFTHFQSLINHMRLHSSESPFRCTECSRKFRQVGNLSRHMTTHRGIKPHKCSECSKAFADPATLRNHVRTHTKETPYVCPICKRGFTQVGNLKRHKVVHQQHSIPRAVLPPPPTPPPAPAEAPRPTPFNDDPTPPTVVRRARHPLERHFECDQCGKRFAWSYDLETHYRVHSGEKPYQCDKCKKTFAQSGAVRMHKQRHHPDDGTDSDTESNPVNNDPATPVNNNPTIPVANNPTTLVNNNPTTGDQRSDNSSEH